MSESDTKTTLTAEGFMRSLAEQLAHQAGGTIADFKYYCKPKEKAKDETA